VKSRDSSVSAAEACRGISLIWGQVGASYGSHRTAARSCVAIRR
jgi:hypothetical protein